MKVRIGFSTCAAFQGPRPPLFIRVHLSWFTRAWLRVPFTRRGVWMEWNR